jgi:hypothetical protein
LLPSNQSLINCGIKTSISWGSPVVWGWFRSCFLISLHHHVRLCGRGHWRKWCPPLHMWGQDGHVLVYLTASYLWRMIFPTGRILWMNLVTNVGDLVIQFEMAWWCACQQSIEQYSSKDHTYHSERY